MIVHTTNQKFSDDVLKSDLPVLVDFWASWCQPCLMLGPILEDLDHDTDGLLKIVKINVDQEYQLAEQFRITSIPSLILFKDGKPVKQTVGVLSKQKLKEFVAL